MIMNTQPDLQSRFTGRKVMIAGGVGFIGSNLAHRLVNLGAKVHLVDALIQKHGANLFNISAIENEVKLSKIDVRDEKQMLDLIKNQDYLFNFAGQTSHLDSMKDPYTDLEMNCRTSLSILEACRQYNPNIKIIYTGTRQIYGKPDYLPVDEKHPLHPIDINGINKIAGEGYHVIYNRVYGIKTCILRLTNTYGPRMRVKDTRQTFLGWWIRQLIQNQEIQVFGDGTQLRDFSYVDDAIEALLLAAVHDDCNGEIFNVGGDEVINLQELAELLILINGGGRFSIVPFPREQKVIDIGSYYTNDHKIKMRLGWHPQVPLKEGLKQTLEYYKKYHEYYW